MQLLFKSPNVRLEVLRNVLTEARRAEVHFRFQILQDLDDFEFQLDEGSDPCAAVTVTEKLPRKVEKGMDYWLRATVEASLLTNSPIFNLNFNEDSLNIKAPLNLLLFCRPKQLSLLQVQALFKDMPNDFDQVLNLDRQKAKDISALAS